MVGVDGRHARRAATRRARPRAAAPRAPPRGARRGSRRSRACRSQPGCPRAPAEPRAPARARGRAARRARASTKARSLRALASSGCSTTTFSKRLLRLRELALAEVEASRAAAARPSAARPRTRPPRRSAAPRRVSPDAGRCRTSSSTAPGSVGAASKARSTSASARRELAAATRAPGRAAAARAGVARPAAISASSRASASSGSSRRELELDERLEQPRIARRARQRGEQRRLRRARSARRPRGARTRSAASTGGFGWASTCVEHGAAGVGLAELVEGARAAHFVGRREVASAAREHAVGEDHLAPLLRVVVDARLEPVELEGVGRQRDGPIDRGDGGRQVAEPLLATASMRWMLRAVSRIFTSSRRIAAASAKRPSATASCASAVACDRIVGKGVGQLDVAGARVGELVRADLDARRSAPRAAASARPPSSVRRRWAMASAARRLRSR